MHAEFILEILTNCNLSTLLKSFSKILFEIYKSVKESEDNEKTESSIIRKVIVHVLNKISWPGVLIRRRLFVISCEVFNIKLFRMHDKMLKAVRKGGGSLARLWKIWKTGRYASWNFKTTKWVNCVCASTAKSFKVRSFI